MAPSSSAASSALAWPEAETPIRSDRRTNGFVLRVEGVAVPDGAFSVGWRSPSGSNERAEPGSCS